MFAAEQSRAERSDQSFGGGELLGSRALPPPLTDSAANDANKPRDAPAPLPWPLLATERSIECVRGRSVTDRRADPLRPPEGGGTAGERNAPTEAANGVVSACTVAVVGVLPLTALIAEAGRRGVA
jgi:hypothetical protein